MKIWIRTLAVMLVGIASSAIAADSAQLITSDQVIERIESKDADMVVLDVRTTEEFAAGHVPGARNIPHDQLPNRLAELAGAKDKEIVVYCRSGRRSEIALDTLASHGFKRVRHMDGDMLKWQEEKRPIEK